jgi:hypothetical protein
MFVLNNNLDKTIQTSNKSGLVLLMAITIYCKCVLANKIVSIVCKLGAVCNYKFKYYFATVSYFTTVGKPSYYIIFVVFVDILFNNNRQL